MAEARDWPDGYPVGTPDWFDAMKKRLKEIDDGGDPSASSLSEHVKTKAEAETLLELVRRKKASGLT